MSIRFVEKNGKYAVWSTVIEDFLVTDIYTKGELAEWYADYKAKKARERAVQQVIERTEAIENDNLPPNYYGAVGLTEAMEDLHE